MSSEKFEEEDFFGLKNNDERADAIDALMEHLGLRLMVRRPGYDHPQIIVEKKE